MSFLSQDELRARLGTPRRKRQIEILRGWGVEPFINARGELQVCLAVLEEAQRVRSGLELQAAKRGPRPNLAAVR